MACILSHSPPNSSGWCKEKDQARASQRQGAVNKPLLAFLSPPSLLLCAAFQALTCPPGCQAWSLPFLSSLSSNSLSPDSPGPGVNLRKRVLTLGQGSLFLAKKYVFIWQQSVKLTPLLSFSSPRVANGFHLMC